MVGFARTVLVDGDFLEVLMALREAQPGEVLMIDAQLRGGAGQVFGVGGDSTSVL